MILFSIVGQIHVVLTFTCHIKPYETVSYIRYIYIGEAHSFQAQPSLLWWCNRSGSFYRII